MVKVAVFFHSVGLNGANRSLLDLIEKIDKKRIGLVFFLPRRDSNLESKIKEYGQIYILRYGQCVKKAGINIVKTSIAYSKFVLGIINTVVRGITIFKKEKIDVVYTNTSVIYNGALLSKLCSKPHVWHIREFLSHEHGIVPLLGRKEHYKIVDKNSTKIVVISKSLYEEYSKNVINDRFVVLYNDVSNKYNTMPRYDWNIRKNYLCMVGNISRGKGQLIAVKAVKKILKNHGKIKLYIAGDYTDKKYYSLLCKYIKKYKLKSVVKLLGNVGDINGLREKMGIEIIASKKEAFGRVTIEGMMSGLIVIGANDAATKELITDGVNGFLFTLDNYNSLCRTIDKAMNLSKEEAEKIIDYSKVFSTRFCEGTCVTKLMSIFEEVAGLQDLN